MLSPCPHCQGDGFKREPRCNCREAMCPHEPVFGHPEDPQPGLYNKFWVRRTNGGSRPGGKHEKCRYFVLDVNHDPFAVTALRAYAAACQEKYPELADDLRDIARKATEEKQSG